MNEKDRIFVDTWQAYTGISGVAKFCFPFFLIGIAVSPVILTALNPNIWELLRESTINRAWAPVAFLAFFFSVLPLLTVGIILWKSKNRRYNLLTTGEERYLPQQERIWKGNDQTWHSSIVIGGQVMLFLGIFSIGFLIAHNPPRYYSYPFFTSIAGVAFTSIYAVAHMLYFRFQNGILRVPALVKIMFVLSLAAVILAYLNIFVFKQMI